jgi:hypothetical protein
MTTWTPISRRLVYRQKPRLNRCSMPLSLALTGATVELVLLFRASIGADERVPSGGIMEFGGEITGDAGQNICSQRATSI